MLTSREKAREEEDLQFVVRGATGISTTISTWLGSDRDLWLRDLCKQEGRGLVHLNGEPAELMVTGVTERPLLGAVSYDVTVRRRPDCDERVHSVLQNPGA